MNSIMITDMSGARPEHSVVITNFVSVIRPQLKNSTCFVFPDNVQYKWLLDDGSERIVIPDASINCRVKSRRGNNFLDAPRLVMEVLSPSTETYDRGEKKDIYCQQEIDEYWIVDWRKRSVEIYVLDYEDETPKYYLYNTITEQNKEMLKIIHFPHIHITFEDLFYEVEL